MIKNEYFYKSFAFGINHRVGGRNHAFCHGYRAETNNRQIIFKQMELLYQFYARVFPARRR